MSLTSRQIDVTITLGTGNYGQGLTDSTFGQQSGNANQVKLSGLYVHADITKVGSPNWDQAEVRVYGVPKTLMNQLTRLGKPLAYTRNNILTLTAGDSESGMSQVFTGQIITAYGDFDGMPDVDLVFTCAVNPIPAAQRVPPLSFPQPTPAATIVAQIAAASNRGFVNSGVSVVIPGSPYFAGSSMQQLAKVAEAGNFAYATDGGNDGQSIEIWPKGTSRGPMGPLISPSTGLVGYPKYSDAGVQLTALYVPGIAGVGTAFTLQTSIDPAVGTWYVLHLEYELECNNPSGDNPWWMHIEAQRATFAS